MPNATILTDAINRLIGAFEQNEGIDFQLGYLAGLLDGSAHQDIVSAIGQAMAATNDVELLVSSVWNGADHCIHAERVWDILGDMGWNYAACERAMEIVNQRQAPVDRCVGSPHECDDRDQSNPNEMTAEQWSEFYGDCENRTGMSFDEYLDNDHSMDG